MRAIELAKRHPLWLIAAAGLAARLLLAFGWYGNGDLFTFETVGGRAKQDLLHVYATNEGAARILYPYPPGYLPWLVAALESSRSTGVAFSSLAHLLPIAADVGIAIAVYVYLGWRGAPERRRLYGFAIVMLGPVFMAISGYHGQLDAVAILPGVLAVMAWERRPKRVRALEAGVLLGLGGLVKTVPLLLTVPLLASTRSIREGARLVVAAGGVVALVCLPFLIAEPHGFRSVLGYTGVPGRGGLSLIADPAFAADRRLSPALSVLGTPNELAASISEANGPITIVVLIAVGALLLRYRPRPIEGIVVLWLAIFVFSPNFLMQYLVWALPFFLMAGYVRETALLQLALVPALVITYLGFGAMTPGLADAYVAMMIALWIFWVLALATVVRRMVARSPKRPPRRPAHRQLAGFVADDRERAEP